MSDVQRILIVTKSRYLGDTIVAVPAMRALAARYPQAHITLLSNPAAGELLRGCPYVHEYLARPVAARRRTDLEMWRVLRRKKYDMAVLFNRSLSSAVLAFMARIPQRVGFDTEGRGFLLTQRVPYEPPKHEILHLLDVAEACGAPAQGTHMELWVTREEREAIRDRLTKEGIDLSRADTISAARSKRCIRQTLANRRVHLGGTAAAEGVRFSGYPAGSE
jgi:heptosyltransferase-2